MSHDPLLSPGEKRALLERLLRAKLRQERRLPLTPGQRRLWQLQSLDEQSPVLNISLSYRMRGPLDVGAFEKALGQLVDRHESLRTTIALDRGEPVQVIRPERTVPLAVEVAAAASQADWARHVEERARVDASTPFDLSRGPLARFRLLSRCEDEHAFLVTTHHIISDRWSLGILIRELGVLYTSIALGGETPGEAPPRQYSDFCRWQEDWVAGGNLEPQRGFWRENLRGPVAELSLPIDRRPSPTPSSTGRRRGFMVSPDLAEAITTFAVGEGLSPYVVLLAGFAVVLHQHSLQKDMVVCLPVSGRHRPQTRDIVGYFNNILPIRLDLSGNPTFRRLLGRVGLAVRQAFEHQDVPFQEIAELPDLGLTPLSRCLCSLQSFGTLVLKLPGVTSTYEDVPTGASDFPLAVFLEEQGGELKGFIDYRTDLFGGDGIERLLERYLGTLRRMVESPALYLDQLGTYSAPAPRTSGPSAAPNPGLQAPGVPPRPGGASAPVSTLPRSELERQLIRIWEEVLGVRPISRNSNFFELGGHSLLAARLFARVETLVGRSLPLALLLRAPTIAALGDLLTQEGWSPSWSSLVPINPDGDRIPLYLVHGGGGNVISYGRLSDHLGKGQPVWGLQSRGLRALQDIDSRIEDVADHYLEAIRFQRPHGPYLLGGHSFGALVALEMAQRLLADKESVPLLFLLDHAGPEARVVWTEWIRRHWICLQQLEMQDRPRYVIDGLTFKIRKSRRLPAFVRQIAAGAMVGNGGKQKANLRIRQLQASLSAIERYNIRSYPGKLIVVRGEQSDARMHSDRWSGWRKVAAGGIEVLEIPGHHMNLLEEPQVGFLAEKMKGALTELVITGACSSSGSTNRCDQGQSPSAGRPSPARRETA